MKNIIKVLVTIFIVIFICLIILNQFTNQKILTEIIINAPSEDVWQVLMNHEEYPNWNPFIINIDGSAKVGEKISVTIHPKGKDPMVFNPIVLKNEYVTEFRWLGKLFIKGLFDGEHFFILKKTSSDYTLFVHGENFSGIFSGLLMQLTGETTLTGFIDMNNALKKEAESKNEKLIAL